MVRINVPGTPSVRGDDCAGGKKSGSDDFSLGGNTSQLLTVAHPVD